MNRALLTGVVGSTAYGLARPGSDVDRLGVFAVRTAELFGLDEPQPSIVSTDPDITQHEARKYAKLALGGNPTVSELMWLPDNLYEVRTELGQHLIGIRSAFLSAKRVRDAYLGYATQQFRRLDARADGSFSADTRKRTAKHARHLYRLCHQGYLLYATGELEIRLAEPWRFHEFGDRVAAGNLDVARDMLREYETKFDAATSVLPDDPAVPVVEDWLLTVRRAFL